MACLTELAIQIGEREFDEAPLLARDFNVNAHVCGVTFAAALAKSRIGGLRKLNINLSDAAPSEGRYWKFESIGHFQFQAIDIRAYARLSLVEKQKLTLLLIRDALLWLGDTVQIDSADVVRAYEKCLAQPFPLDPTYFDRMLKALGPKR